MTHRSFVLLALVGLAACDGRLDVEEWTGWYDPGTDYDVAEPVTFTDAPYDFPADAADGIGDLLANEFDYPRPFGTNVAEDDFTEGISGCADWYSSSTLPRQITGVVTAHPRYYFKGRGCDTDDEKFYGSYFLEDRTGGVFVLGDSKVAHFDMGATVTLEVRATRTSFDLEMIYAATVVDVVHEPVPISYVVKQAPFSVADNGRVRRITGTIVGGPDNFGETLLAADDFEGECSINRPSNCAKVQLDVELNRRGITFVAGERVRLTGPILFSYDNYSLVLTRLGQIERLND